MTMSTKTANIKKSTVDEVDSEECAQISDPSVFYVSNAQLDICDVVLLREDQDEDAPRAGVVMGIFHGDGVPGSLAILWPDGSITKHHPDALAKVGPIDK